MMQSIKKLLMEIPPIKRQLARIDMMHGELTSIGPRIAELAQSIDRLQASLASQQAETRRLGEDMDSIKSSLAQVEARKVKGRSNGHLVHQASAATFEQLLNRDGEARAGEIVFYPAVPKTGCNTIAELFRQNSYWQLDLDFESNDFFRLVDEDRWHQQRLRCFFLGHYPLGLPRLAKMELPFVVIATLRHPVDRVLSAYNHALVSPAMPHHGEIGAGSMSFLEYVEAYLHEAGPQYRFFDDTTVRHTEPGNATVQQCLQNLLTRVSCFGFTDRLEEFAVVLGYLLRLGNILNVGRINVTGDLPNPGNKVLKAEFTSEERRVAESMLEDDLWFYDRAQEIYERRTSDQRLQSVLASSAPLRGVSRDAMRALLAIDDPAAPGRPAFDTLKFRES
jgi:hypothetical protein